MLGGSGEVPYAEIKQVMRLRGRSARDKNGGRGHAMLVLKPKGLVSSEFKNA